MVEIAKAISEKAKIVIMDEPTTSLTPREVETLFATVRLLHSAASASSISPIGSLR